MRQKPLLSVLLPFHNQRDEVEPTLTALYELEMPLEIILINDGSSDGTGEVIESLLDYYEHERTFYFEHTRPAGRGCCLNEALQQGSAPLLWAPESIREIDESTLRRAVRNLRQESAACLIQRYDLPADASAWSQHILNGPLAEDGKILWNKAHIPTRQQFFNPFLENYTGIERLMRLEAEALQIEDQFYASCKIGSVEAPPQRIQQELIMTLLRRSELNSSDRRRLVSLLWELPAHSGTDRAAEEHLLKKAVRQKLEGQLTAALETIEKVLKEDPAHPEANHLKVKLLEGKRRFVEAAELKHQIQTDEKSRQKQPEEQATNIRTSLIIPTALYGKPALEHCLLSVDKYCNEASTELIIVDNASLDDTHDYLKELQEKNFFHCRLITNSQNRGFAGSVNQGLDAARGRYACVIHNDVEFTGKAVARLEQLMNAHPDYALIGPLAESTLNPDQLKAGKSMYEGELEPADYIDSFCMMIRTNAGLRMDERYGLAFFDDIDLAFEARKNGFKVGIAPGVEVTHHYGATTFVLDLDTESELYWKNIAYFNDKWKVQTYSEKDLQASGRFEQLLMLDKWANPLFPEKKIKTKFEALFTDELKTEILKSSHEPETLLRIIHLLMVMEKREVMRRLEDRAENVEMPAGLIYELVRFYFKRNVYSRCQFYLNRLTSQQESMRADLYRLAMLIDEKKMEQAVPLLTQLMDKAPANPTLYKLAGDVHAFEGNSEEAASFYGLAEQINPFAYPADKKKMAP